MSTRVKTITIGFALLVSGAAMIPQSVAARARESCGVIRAIDLQARTLTIHSAKRESSATFAEKDDTRFIKNRKFTNHNALKSALRAYVYYRSPLFGKPFVTKVNLDSQQNPG